MEPNPYESPTVQNQRELELAPAIKARTLAVVFIVILAAILLLACAGCTFLLYLVFSGGIPSPD
ncbi:hypothetical protein ETAA8_10810 [Anatilimnocola aggregata]|uniref:Uncharacterized protein n=1 Tax=Anatilimnocola aggregata TaxID=2528021 RepID=A0A517Y6Z8_9BACT|nr:hypothetical protein [Anatilimnocola aggregata]QDU26009.1 hypothetical protein ETAA8_10810 [Anatilimnocola aggregata]